MRIWVGGFFSPLLWTVGGDGGGGCLCCIGVFFFFFAMEVFIIILMSCLHYFNQIVKNIDPLMLGMKR